MQLIQMYKSNIDDWCAFLFNNLTYGITNSRKLRFRGRTGMYSHYKAMPHIRDR